MLAFFVFWIEAIFKEFPVIYNVSAMPPPQGRQYPIFKKIVGCAERIKSARNLCGWVQMNFLKDPPHLYQFDTVEPKRFNGSASSWCQTKN